MEFSVIIPVYNGEMFLSECLDSMTRQGFCEGLHEVIIVDDGSTDDTAEIAAKYYKKYPYFKFIKTENKGVSAARNIGILQSFGDYITFMDSDDIFADYSYLPLLNMMQNKNFDLLIFNHTSDYSELQKISLQDNYKFYDSFCTTSSGSAIYKKDIITNQGILFREKQAGYEDYTFNYKYSHYIRNGCAYVFKKPYFYRKNPNSATGGIKSNISDNARLKSLNRSFEGSFIAMKEINDFTEKNGFEKDDFYSGAISACMQTYLLMSVYLKEKPKKSIGALKGIGLSLHDLKIRNIEGPTKKERIKSEVMYLMRHRVFFDIISLVYRIFGR